MTYTPIPIGLPDWGDEVNDAFTSQDARITVNEADITDIESDVTVIESEVTALQNRTSEQTALDHGMIAWSIDHAASTGTQAPTAGTLFMVKVSVPNATTINSVGLGVSSTGTLTAGQNFAGIYNSSGTLVATSADETTNWGSVGFRVSTMTTPFSASPGYYYIGLLMNGTPPVLARGSNYTASATIANANLTAATARFATGGTALTALPASVTMASRTLSSTAWWMTIQ